jgi:hypothetical protein
MVITRPKLTMLSDTLCGSANAKRHGRGCLPGTSLSFLKVGGLLSGGALTNARSPTAKPVLGTSAQSVLKKAGVVLDVGPFAMLMARRHTSAMRALNTIARNLTIPKRVRSRIDNNVAVIAVTPDLVPALVVALANTVDTHVNDAEGNAALKDALALAVRQVFGGVHP